MSSDVITLTGLVATNPRHIVTSEGLSITSFRLASTQRRFDRGQERWVDVETNWYTITSFRQLALNCATSIDKGQRVLVTGRLRIREWDNGERVGTTVEIEADSIGHDLMWGSTQFTRSILSSSSPLAAGDSTEQKSSASEWSSSDSQQSATEPESTQQEPVAERDSTQHDSSTDGEPVAERPPMGDRDPQPVAPF